MENYLRFVLAVVAISILKTISLSTGFGIHNENKTVLERIGEKRIVMVPTIEGTDVAMPFEKMIETKTRSIGKAEIRYAVLPGTAIRDIRYGSMIK